MPDADSNDETWHPGKFAQLLPKRAGWFQLAACTHVRACIFQQQLWRLFVQDTFSAGFSMLINLMKLPNRQKLWATPSKRFQQKLHFILKLRNKTVENKPCEFTTSCVIKPAGAADQQARKTRNNNNRAESCGCSMSSLYLHDVGTKNELRRCKMC